MRLTLVEMLHHFQLEKDVKSNILCRGLCSPSLLSRRKDGNRSIDTLTFIQIVERMGVSAEHFSLMITEEECDYLDWRGAVLDGIQDKAWTRLEELLQRDKRRELYCNSKLGQQFEAYAMGVYEASRKNEAVAIRYFKHAMEQSIPDTADFKNKKILLSAMELSTLMLYLYYGLIGDVLSQREGMRIV